MKNSFLQTAGKAAAVNTLAWKERFGQAESCKRRPGPPFLPVNGEGCGIIAEVKLKSPSRGALIEVTRAMDLPEKYESGGAEAVSVVVEERHFGGSPELFGEVAARTQLPLLWKDFVIDPFQIGLAARLGASGILLIAGLLPGDALPGMIEGCRREGLRPLVEVHDEDELSAAIDGGADLVGVNNRNLVTLEVDTGLSERLAPFVGGPVQGVAESGFHRAEDIRRMRDLGYRAVLVGEALIRADELEKKLGAMVGAGRRG